MMPCGKNSVGRAVSSSGYSPNDQVVAHALAVASPVLVEGGDRQEIGNVDPRDEVARAGDELLQAGDRARVQGRLTVWIDRRRHATHQETLQMGVLAAEHRVHLDELALPVERLEIVRDRHQVGLGRELVGRMAPVGVGKRSQLPALDKSLDPVAHAARSTSDSTAASPRSIRRATRSSLDRPTARRRCRPSRARGGGRSGRRDPARTAPR